MNRKAGSLRARVTIVSLVFMAVVGGAIGITNYAGQRVLLSEMEQVKMATQSAVLARTIEGHLAALKEAGGRIVKGGDTAKAFAERKKDDLVENARPPFNRLDGKLGAVDLRFYEPPARLFLSVAESSLPSADFSGKRPLVVRASDQKKMEAGIVVQDGGGLALSAVVPVYVSGDFVGTAELLTGFEPVLKGVQQLMGAQALLLVPQGSSSAPKEKAVGDYVVAGATDEKALAPIVASLKVAKTLSAPVQQQIAAGGSTWAASQLPLKGADDKSVGVVVVVTDVTPFGKAASRTMLITLLIGVGGFAGVAVVVFLMMGRSFAPLKNVVQAMGAIAGGNLGVEVKGGGSEEVETLSEGMNKMVGDLAAIIDQVSSASRHVAEASEGLARSSETLSQGTDTQTQQAATVAAAMEEMSATVIEVARNSQKAADEAQGAANLASQGGQIVQETIGGMERIAHSVEEIGRTIEVLGKNSTQIGEIVAVIEDIADQTNLLALNAAIEAARAGEQGRGFAVVADEVRKLAERTTKATKEIGSMIRSVQDETRKAVEAMETGDREVKSGATSAQSAGESLGRIVTSVQRVSDMIRQIATAAEEQSAASEEISASVERIAGVTRETATSVQGMTGTTQELSHMAVTLRTIVGHFKLNGREHSSPVTRH